MKIYLDNNLGVTKVEQEELTQDTYGYNILKVYIPNAVLTPYDTFTCYYGALLQNGRKVGWFAMEAKTSTDADYEKNYTLYKATLEQCVVSVEGKVYIGCQVLLGNSGNTTLIKKNTAVVQFNVRKSVAINNDILVLDTDQTTTDVLESYKNLLENALTTYATKATTYTKTEVNSALALKADKSTTYTKAEVYTKTEVDDKLDLKADKSTTYTKTEVDEKDLNLARQIAGARVELNNRINTTDGILTATQAEVAKLKSVQNVVEVVATYSALQSYDTTKLDANDKIQVIADESHDSASTIYNWNGSAWVYVGAFGGNSYTKAETYNKTQIDSALSDKADKSDTYTKTEEDAKFEEVGQMFEIVGNEVLKKADKTDTYTKQEVNDKLDGYIKDNDTTYSATVRGKEVIVSTGTGYGSTTYGHSSINIGNPRKPTCDYYFPEEKSGTLALTSDIPTVNNPTITFTQGGTTKGSISLNQSTNQTIALDAGGSGGGTTVVANPTLSGDEPNLEGAEIDGIKYKVGGGGGATLDDIVDSQNRKRFIEGNGTTKKISGVTFTYNKWSLSGTHLMLVLAGTVASGGGANAGQTFVEYELPNWIMNKINPLSENGLVTAANIRHYVISSGFYSDSKEILLKKTTNKLSIVYNGGGTFNNTVTFRIQLDLLIDSE